MATTGHYLVTVATTTRRHFLETRCCPCLIMLSPVLSLRLRRTGHLARTPRSVRTRLTTRTGSWSEVSTLVQNFMRNPNPKRRRQ